MRDGDVIGIAAIAIDAEAARPHAHILVAGLADGAIAAADPGVDEARLADLDALPSRLGSERHHLARRLMSHCERERDAAILQ